MCTTSPFKKSGYVAAAAGPSAKRPRIEQTSSETGKKFLTRLLIPPTLCFPLFQYNISYVRNNGPSVWFSYHLGKILGRKNITQGKYSAISTAALPHLASLPASVDESLVAAAFSASTWKRMSAAISSFKRFAMGLGTTLSWPFSSENVNRYIVWSQKTAKLSPQTVTAYLSDLATCHKLRGMDPSACSSFLAKTMLKGAKNLASYKATPKKTKLIMTLSCLKILGHEIASTGWPTIRKAVCWAACTLAFFGSFRMSEILCPADNTYNADTLVWSDVIFHDTNSVTIKIRHPKSNRSGGEKVDVFKFAGHNCCPVKALLALQKLRKAKQHDPVFAFSETEYLSKKHFNDVISCLLCKHIPDCRILGHSFRAGIPSALSAVPDLVTPEEIQAWGRWASDSYKPTRSSRTWADNKFLRSTVSTAAKILGTTYGK